jgi:hypothetical protein
MEVNIKGEFMNSYFSKKAIFSLLTCSIIGTISFQASATSARRELLRDIKIQTKQCVVQIVSPVYESQNENVLGYKSLCGSLVIISPLEAQINIDGRWYQAVIKDSDESDGGDINDLSIMNSRGVVLATKTNIPAYDSVVVAMAGDNDFKKVLAQ